MTWPWSIVWSPPVQVPGSLSPVPLQTGAGVVPVAGSCAAAGPARASTASRTARGDSALSMHASLRAVGEMRNPLVGHLQMPSSTWECGHVFHAVAAAALAFPLGGVGEYRVPPQ